MKLEKESKHYSYSSQAVTFHGAFLNSDNINSVKYQGILIWQPSVNTALKASKALLCLCVTFVCVDPSASKEEAEPYVLSRQHGFKSLCQLARLLKKWGVTISTDSFRIHTKCRHQAYWCVKHNSLRDLHAVFKQTNWCLVRPIDFTFHLHKSIQTNVH